MSNVYDFVLHFFQSPKRCFKSKWDWKVSKRVFFIAQHEGSKDALSFVQLFSKIAEWIWHLFEYFTWALFIRHRLCGNYATCFFEAFVSANQIPFSYRWIGCNSHQLNTVMKHVVDFSLLQDSAITKSTDLVKMIVKTFMHASINSKLPPRSALQQEVATRFGTTCEIVGRFISSYA